MPFKQPKKYSLLAGLGMAASLVFFLLGSAAANPDASTTLSPPATPLAGPIDQDRYESPLAAGTLTLQDVLQAHKPKTAAPAVAQQGAAGSATSVMLMQGMQSALQQGPGVPNGAAPVNGKNTSGGLQAPLLPSAAAPAASSAAPVAAAAVAPAAPGVAYEPGRAPKNLADAALADVPTSTASGCAPHAERWTKSCAEAGYPADFVGQIVGETRTSCIDNNLKDVWVSNSCAAGDGSTNMAGPHMDGACGEANGSLRNDAPAEHLCKSGEAGPVSGDAPWEWECKGSGGGVTAGCAAFAQSKTYPGIWTASSSADDGVCGNTDGGDAMPSDSDLCAKGVASRVNGDGPWTWACSGVNGGRAVACTKAKKTDAQCGVAANSSTTTAPKRDLCMVGQASTVNGSGPWSWTCNGLNGGASMTCVTTAKRDGVCGNAALKPHRQQPSEGLCSSGEASNVSSDGDNGPWSWTCMGINGGASASCVGRASVNGACGPANGSAVAKMPASGLCAQGHATPVTGSGPWNWNCRGIDGGDTQSCIATVGTDVIADSVDANTHAKPEADSVPVAATLAAAPTTAPAASASHDTVKVAAESGHGADLCGTAAEQMAFEMPVKNLCRHGKAGDVNGDGPWNWVCSDNQGHTSSCATLGLEGVAPAAADAATEATETARPAKGKAKTKPKNGKLACGAAADHGSTVAPSDDLCEVGTASTVHGSGPWHWSCANGKTRILCHAPRLVNGACGASNGAVLSTMPASGLCDDGTPTAVQGNGPWSWSCNGSGAGASVSCSAAAQSALRVDGTCGEAAVKSFASAPSSGLCASGMASPIFGEGPWSWSCSGSNGGAASSCTAQRGAAAPLPPGPAVNGLCGSANGMTASMTPQDNLCVSGSPTDVVGNGPWNWSCLGENGGMTVSCTALLTPPAPIEGVCGGANGVPALTIPKSGLCSAGISSAVSGSGPWTWSCSGANGGGAVACVAPMAGGSQSGLPSMVTPGNEAANIQAADTAALAAGLQTPHLPSDHMAALDTATLPSLTTTNKKLQTPQLKAHVPQAANLAGSPNVPSQAPDLPTGTKPVPPPAEIDDEGMPVAPPQDGVNSTPRIPGNHLTLDPTVSTVIFIHGSGNIDPKTLPTLDKLAQILVANPDVRVTLIAYADVLGSTPRDARRLSLTRAIAVRDYLASKAVDNSRVDVRAMGANAPTGYMDRVDIKVNN
jgi:outer membrane protein OmpA-like peptidoglycan-associated protein